MLVRKESKVRFIKKEGRVKRDIKLNRRFLKTEGREGRSVEDFVLKQCPEFSTKAYKDVIIPLEVHVFGLTPVETDPKNDFVAIGPRISDEVPYRCLVGKADVTVQLRGMHCSNILSRSASKEEKDIHFSCRAFIMPPVYGDSFTKGNLDIQDILDKGMWNDPKSSKGYLSLVSSEYLKEGYGSPDDIMATYLVKHLLNSDEVLFEGLSGLRVFPEFPYCYVYLGILKRDVDKIHAWFEDMEKKYGGPLSRQDAENIVGMVDIDPDDGDYEDFVDGVLDGRFESL